MHTQQVALYARVSSSQQAQAQTIQSQVTALRERIAQDDETSSPAQEFIDDGCSGSTLIRPSLERLRDAIARGELDRLYVHSPDRLARKYAYQVLLIDEFQRAGTTVVFLNRELSQSPEDELLLQVQGMIAEYERAKLLERSRRGKRHKAQQGSINVLSGAPYGYRYVTCAEGGGEARYEIVEEQAQVIRQIFDWMGRERLSLSDVCRRLMAAGIATPRGKVRWDRKSVWGMLTNPAYRGQAMFGKTRAIEERPRRYRRRGCDLHTHTASARDQTPVEEQLSIDVPALVDTALFEAVQAQLEENRLRTRARRKGQNLLQGLLVCGRCGHAYCPRNYSPGANSKRPKKYFYHRCIGCEAYRFGGKAICDNTAIRTDLLEQTVWQEVCQLLKDPQRLAAEYQRRLETANASPSEAELARLKKQTARVRQSITRLIDGYAEGYLDKTEAEPRIRRFKERLKTLEAQTEQWHIQATQQADLQLIVDRLEEFSTKVNAGLDQLDWQGRRELIRTLVKRVEIDLDLVTVVFRVEEATLPPVNSPIRQHCGRREHAHPVLIAMPIRDEDVETAWRHSPSSGFDGEAMPTA